MDLNEYWQENKRFVTMVAIGALVFLIGYLVLDGKYESAISSQNLQKARLDSELRKSLFSAADLDDAEDENERLNAAVEELSARADFEPRELFRIDRGGGAPSVNSQYLRALTDVRDRLIPRANRSNMKLDPGLGMPELSPTREEQIERYLEALDIIESVADLAIEAGVRRLDEITIRLDPALGSRQGVGRIERTRVKFSFEGEAKPLTQLMARTQRTSEGRQLLIDEVEMIASKSRPGDSRLDLTMVAARLQVPTTEEDA
ncbi:MAG: hypothetical protein AAF682_05160 [Planctomycetota bacterium]